MNIIIEQRIEYCPQENDCALIAITTNEEADLEMYCYTQNHWSYQSILRHDMIVRFLQHKRKIYSFGHYDEGYYR